MLENRDISLRALEPKDVDTLFIWENDRRNWRVSHTLSPFSRHAIAQYIESVRDIHTDKQLRLMIVEKSSEKAVGAIDLFDCDFKNHRSGIGVLIADTDARNLGLASQTLEVLIEYCFKELGFHQLYCGIQVDNAASLALFKKFGFREIGIRKDWNYFNGQFSDEISLQLING